MNKTLFAVIGLMLLPLPALSQTMSRPDDQDSSYGRGDRDRGGGSFDRRDRQDDGDWGDLSHNMYRDMDREGSGRGAVFRLRNGSAAVTVRCDPRESMRSCVDATVMLLDRASRALPQGGSSSTAPSTGGGQGTGPGGATPPRQGM